MATQTYENIEGAEVNKNKRINLAHYSIGTFHITRTSDAPWANTFTTIVLK